MSLVCMKGRGLGRVDLQSCRPMFGINIDDSTPIFESSTAVPFDQLVPFFSISPLPSAISVPSITTDDKRKRKGYGSEKPGRAFRKRHTPLPPIRVRN